MAHEGETGQGDDGEEALHAGSKRDPGPPVTDFIGFAAAWPGVSERLADVLRRRGVPSETGSEVVQEVGLRALERLAARRSFDSTDGFYRWARTVGVNLVTDRWRRQVPQSAELSEDDAPIVDIESLVQWRTLLAEVVRLWPALPERDRQALVALWTEPTGETKKGAQGMRRLRARRRLRRWTGGLPAGWRWRLRWVTDLVPLGVLSAAFVVTAALLPGGPVPLPPYVVTTVGRDLPEQKPPIGPPRGPEAAQTGRGDALLPDPLPEAVAAKTTLAEIPKPVGGTTRAGTSENSPDKALVCVDSDVLDVCVDKPVLP